MESNMATHTTTTRILAPDFPSRSYAKIFLDPVEEKKPVVAFSTAAFDFEDSLQDDVFIGGVPIGTYTNSKTKSKSVFYCGICKKHHKAFTPTEADVPAECPHCHTPYTLHHRGSTVKYAVSKTEWHDTGNISYHLYHRSVAYSISKNQFYPVNRTSTLLYKKKANKWLTKAGSRVNSAVQDYLLPLLKEYYPEIPVTTRAQLLIANNPRLIDLFKFNTLPKSKTTWGTSMDTLENWAAAFMLQGPDVKHRKRIYYAYDKHGSKGAFKAIAPSINSKIIRRFLWSYMAMHKVPDLNHLLTLGFTVAHLEEMVQASVLIQKSPRTMNFIESLGALHELGLTPRRAVNRTKKLLSDPDTVQHMADAARMVRQIRIKDPDYLLPVEADHPHLHDLVLEAYLLRLDNGEIVEYADPKTVYDWENGEYVVSRVRTSKELQRVGSKMLHCVGAYGNWIAQGYTDIYVVSAKTDLDTPLVCISLSLEYSRVKMQQAKLRRNKLVSTNETLFAVVKEWLDKFPTISTEGCSDLLRYNHEEIREILNEPL
jgi:hypothetical protein